MLHGERLTPYRARQGWIKEFPGQPPLDDLALESTYNSLLMALKKCSLWYLAIEACTLVLERHFPARPDEPDEIANKVTEI